MESIKTILQLNEVSIGYRSKKSSDKDLSGPLNLSVPVGALICLLGPNGAGKSTLIRTLSGIQKPLHGKVLIKNNDIHKIKPARKARLLSVVLTDPVLVGNLNVQQLLELGRHPYTNWLGKLNQEDHEIVAWAMKMTDTEAFAEKQLHTLSDGERQKVLIARALAQNTPLMLLDEPTSHLDIPHRIAIVRLLRKLVQETGKTILFSTHELDLALQVADQLWLMYGNQVHTGVPEDLVLNGTFENTFHKDEITFDKQTGTFKVHQPNQKQIILRGEGATTYWTQRALERAGFSIGNSEISVEVEEKNNSTIWRLKTPGDQTTCTSIEELLKKITGVWSSQSANVSEVKTRSPKFI